MGRVTLVAGLLAGSTLAGLAILAAIWSKRRRQNDDEPPEPDAVFLEDTAEEVQEGSLESFIKVDLCMVDDDQTGQTSTSEWPRAPPPTRSTSSLELKREVGDTPSPGSNYSDDGQERRTLTPPPSRNASSSQLNNLVDDLNPETEPTPSGAFLELPGGCPNAKPSRKAGSHGNVSPEISNELAAAVSLSLGMQGFEIIDDNTEDKLGDSDTSQFSLLSSTGAGDSSGQWSLMSSLDNAHLTDRMPPPTTPPSSEEIRDTFQVMESNVADMSSKHASVLTSLLGAQDQALQEQVLVYISNAAAFTKNQNLLREAGCLGRLSSLLKAHGMALNVTHKVAYPSLVSKATTTLNNLAANEENQKQLQDSLPALFKFATDEGSPEGVQLSSLQALTNLSVTDAYHAPYTQIIQHLYELLDTATPYIRKQALKVLVNLSANQNMVPHLLAAKGPVSLLSLLAPNMEEDVLIKWTTFLWNVMATAQEHQLSAASLPTQHKAASPETMYTAIYGVANAAKLRSKVFVLSKHTHSEVRSYASRIYGCLT